MTVEGIADDSGRLRLLLRQQVRAAERGAWPELHALSAAVRDELDRLLAPECAPTAGAAELAEVAHLQLRLERRVAAETRQAAERLRYLAARLRYRSLTDSAGSAAARGPIGPWGGV